MDSSSPILASRRASSSYIISSLKDLNMVDIWHLSNPTVKDYTCFPSRHSSFSRIDYFSISPILVKCTSCVSVFPMLLSNLSPIYDLSHVPVSLQPQGFTYLGIHIRPTFHN